MTAAPVAAGSEANLIMLLVLVVLFFGTVVGFFTYAGSGIGSHPLDHAPGAPGARGQDEFTRFAGRQARPRDLDELAPGLWRLSGWPPNGFNVYVIDAPELATEELDREAGTPGVLVDAGTRYAAARLRRGLHGHPLAAIVLTHAHPDHQGGATMLCRLRDIPLWCGEGDADAVESGRIDTLVPDVGSNRRLARFLAGPPHQVDRRLREGDRIGEFVVLETPGVSPGHISLWREADRVLIAGDVALNQHPVLGRPGLHEPTRRFVADPALHRASLERLAALRPSLVAFGHGRPLAEPDALRALAAAA